MDDVDELIYTKETVETLKVGAEAYFMQLFGGLSPEDQAFLETALLTAQKLKEQDDQFKIRHDALKAAKEQRHMMTRS